MKATGKPAQVHFAYQQIADEIEAQILRGDLNPGDQLPGEAELAGQFGVTRSTLREGLRRDGIDEGDVPRAMAGHHDDRAVGRASGCRTWHRG